MRIPILSDSDSARNPHADLICPRCQAQCRLTRRRITCATCGWCVTLTRIQAREINETLAGVTDLPLPAYLLLLVAESPAPPDGGAFGPVDDWPGVLPPMALPVGYR